MLLKLQLLRAICFITALLVFLSQRQTFGNEKAIRLMGYYEYGTYLNTPTFRVIKQLNFDVTLDRCKWLIQFTNVNPTANDADDLSTRAAYDGTNIYIIQFPSGNADVSVGNYPYAREVHLQDLWLAFASQCVLSNADGFAKPPLPIDIGIFTKSDYNCRYAWVKSSDGVPEKLLFTADSYFGRNHLTGEVVHQKFPAPYGDGYTLAEGDWVSATNVLSTLIPTHFEFTIFGPKLNGSNAADLSKLVSFYCLVTNIIVTASPVMPPKLPSPAFIKDRRFADLGHAYISYVITNGIWPSENDHRIRELLAYAPKFSAEDEALAELGIRQIGDRISPRNKYARLKMARFAVALAIAFPAVFLGIYLINQKRQR